MRRPPQVVSVCLLTAALGAGLACAPAAEPPAADTPAPAPAAQRQAALALPPGLVAAYAFEEGAGTTTADASGRGHTGTLSGATWTRDGRYGGALEFDGVNDRVNVADSSALDLFDRLTLSAWVRPTSLTGWRTILMKERPGGLLYALYASDDTNRPPAGYVHTGTDRKAVAPQKLPLGVWSHVAATYDGAALRFYVDGELAATTPLTQPLHTSSRPLRIGGNAIWREWFQGTIDEVRVYDRALDPRELAVDRDTALACGRPGLDPARGCGDCLPGWRESFHDGAATLDASAAAGTGAAPALTAPAPLACERIPSCAGLDCGPHGACFERDSGGACACAPGYSGPRCADCAPLHDRLADGTCALGDTCRRLRCGGHGACVLEADELACRCDSGWDLDGECGGQSVTLAAPEGVLSSGTPAPVAVGLRNGAYCTGAFTWSVSRGGGTVEPDPRDSRRATYTPPAIEPGRVGHATLSAVCDTDAGLGPSAVVPFAAPQSAPAAPGPWAVGPCPGALATALDDVMLDWIDANGMPGGVVGISFLGAPVCVRAYGLASKGLPSDGSRGIERMRTCTPMRIASVTKSFARSAMRGNLYGAAIPGALGGGTLGDNTALLPLVRGIMGLAPGNVPSWNEPASLYSASWTAALPDGHCTVASNTLDPAWTVATVGRTLDHRAGFQPNASYRVSSSTACNNAPGEVCKSFGTIGDPTVGAGAQGRLANDLGLAYGVPQIDDLVRWMAGVCMYDTQANNFFHYSNFGYSVAGRALERITGQTFASYVTGYLDADGIIDPAFHVPGRPIVYMGQNAGNGPSGSSLPSYMREARYYSNLGSITNLTSAQFDGQQWTFPGVVDAPYGGANYNLMYAHGGLVANVPALMRLGAEYDLNPRSGARRPKPFFPLYDDTTRGGQNGLLWGTFSDVHEFDDSDGEFNRPQGPGCLQRDGSINNINNLTVAPCPLPHGLTMHVLFNGDLPATTSPGYAAGRADMNVLKHGIRQALSDFGPTVEPWLHALLAPSQLSKGCEQKCGPDQPWCVNIDCGDGDVDAGETCDDGNNVDGDGCPGDCKAPVPGPKVPPSYAGCQGRLPGDCLGGPCAQRHLAGADLGDYLDPNGEWHPDGDFSANTQCLDDFTGGGETAEAVCRRELYDAKPFGVCRACGSDTMIGCLCPAPNDEDGGCNGIAENGLECIGGRCWKGAAPSWMCEADCTDIYGASGFCLHDSAKGAVCYDALCSEPQGLTGWCDSAQGRVCDSAPNSCNGGSCCEPECLSSADCDARGYDNFECNAQERCVP